MIKNQEIGFQLIQAARECGDRASVQALFEYYEDSFKVAAMRYFNETPFDFEVSRLPNSDKHKQDTFRLSGEERRQLDMRNEGQRADTGFENDIREHFNFSAPPEKWMYLTVNQVASTVIEGNAGKNDKINLRRSLEALHLKKKNPKNVPHYLLPPEYSLEEKHNALLNGNTRDPFLDDASEAK